MDPVNDYEAHCALKLQAEGFVLRGHEQIEVAQWALAELARFEERFEFAWKDGDRQAAQLFDLRAEARLLRQLAAHAADDLQKMGTSDAQFVVWPRLRVLAVRLGQVEDDAVPLRTLKEAS